MRDARDRARIAEHARLAARARGGGERSLVTTAVELRLRELQQEPEAIGSLTGGHLTQRLAIRLDGAREIVRGKMEITDRFGTVNLPLGGRGS